MGMESPAEMAKIIIRSRKTDPSYIFSFFSQSPDFNYSKLKYMILSSVTEACNNSVFLLGPRGCGKNAIKLNGLLHGDNNCALKESFDEYTQYLLSMLRDCGLAHKTIVFVLDEFEGIVNPMYQNLYPSQLEVHSWGCRFK